MRRHIVAVLFLVPLAGCFGGSTTEDESSYQIDETVTALVVDARAAGVFVEAGDGPVTVREEYRWSGDKPATAHAVKDGTLTLTETGCGNDDVRCEVQFHVRMPAATSTRITAQAGAVKLTGLSGDVRVSTQAGSVEGIGLTTKDLDVRTQAGAATLAFTGAPTSIRAATELGAITVRVPDDRAYAVDAGTGVGAAKVSVRKDPASAHHIAVRTEVGAVQIAPLS